MNQDGLFKVAGHQEFILNTFAMSPPVPFYGGTEVLEPKKIQRIVSDLYPRTSILLN